MCGLVTDIVVFTLASWVAYWTFEGSSPVSKAYLPSLSGPGARRFSPAALHVSSLQVRGIQGLAPTRSLMAHVSHRDTGAQYPVLSLVSESEFSLLIGFHPGRFDRPTSPTGCTWREKSSVHTDPCFLFGHNEGYIGSYWLSISGLTPLHVDDSTSNEKKGVFAPVCLVNPIWRFSEQRLFLL